MAVDDKGFVATGQDLRLPLQTSVPGVFAIGDVRRGRGDLHYKRRPVSRRAHERR